ncbi:NAD(P)H-dependent oxidoreductase [Polynucleobacter sp. MG-28-Ekke-A2]|uniref:NAD(P)H-dependent oxidoreductase n=1 Tax=Polynucleobacter sp. MG-28-Ekke-A2 TaxID=3108276 RepID=UPI002B230B07|nr:NAD(P)H-dependent oxidoreductase [Polynucleobacter sp. MG-28-Ekke-A2]MEA9602096.1 NAD(P)H-dependent oxidoreductase [Polynucleobacter sp. MG-28-Ekke-A2]
MNNVLCLNCSIQGDSSQSRQLSNKLLERIKKTYSSVKIVSRDLVRDPLPHLNGAQFNAFITPPEQRTSEQKVLASQSDDLIKEISDADTVRAMHRNRLELEQRPWDHLLQALSNPWIV